MNLTTWLSRSVQFVTNVSILVDLLGRFSAPSQDRAEIQKLNMFLVSYSKTNTIWFPLQFVGPNLCGNSAIFSKYRYWSTTKLYLLQWSLICIQNFIRNRSVNNCSQNSCNFVRNYICVEKFELSCKLAQCLLLALHHQLFLSHSFQAPLIKYFFQTSNSE